MTLEELRKQLEAESADEGCWEWGGARDGDGYGVKHVDGKQWRVHRLSYYLATGTNPGDLWVLHSCDNPPCFRPAHLRLGTAQDNNRDRSERGRHRNQYIDASACVRGHAFTEDNVYVNPANGSRQCRICRRLGNRFDKRLAYAPKATRRVLRKVFWERVKQDFRFGEQNWPDGTGGKQREAELRDARDLYEMAARNKALTFARILEEEFAEAMAETDPARLREELIQVAAVAVAWVEAIDRRGRAPAPKETP